MAQESYPSNPLEKPIDLNRWIGYLERYGIEIPLANDTDAIIAAIAAAKAVKRREDLGLGPDASDAELEAAKAAKEELDTRRRLGLPDDASSEQVGVWQEIYDKARKLKEFNIELRRLTLRALSQANSTDEGAEAAREELRLFNCKWLSLPNDATDEEVAVARKLRRLADGALHRRREAGLPDDASDDDLRAARRRLAETPMDAETQKAYSLRADLDLPADTPDSIVEVTMEAWDSYNLFAIN